MALIYHNITPPEFFVGLHRSLSSECFRGRRELRAYADRCDLALGDSEFNRQDLEALGFKRTAVLPVVPDFSHLDGRADRTVADLFDDDWTNVLFVGRMVAEQEDRRRHPLLSRVPHVLQPALAAAAGRRAGRIRALHGRAPPADGATLGNTHVHFVGQVSNEELVAFYEVADLFLCASEHEGFCVPLVEAFYKQIPVLAYAATAVPATMDGAGVLYSDKDPSHVAALMDAVVSNIDVQEAVIDGQLAAVDRLRARDFAGTLLGLVDEILPVPARRRPRVDLRLLASVRRGRRARGAAPRSAVDLQGAAAAMIVNQWLAAAHTGRRDRRQRPARPRPAAGPRPRVRAVRPDDRRGPRRRGAAVQRSGRAARRRDGPALRPAVADDRRPGRRSTAGACCTITTSRRPPISRRTTPALFRLAVLARQELATPGRPCRSGAGRVRVQPPGARGARLLAHRRAADRGRHGAHHPARPPPRASSGCWTTSW